ncbi:MAG: nitrogenase component 1 [Pleomorphochaeta sp.]
MIDLHKIDFSTSSNKISQLDFNTLFYSGLQYAPPARGVWNIVHVGFLMPESHEIFVCAEGCIRGVVLTAHEAGFESRFSTVVIQERNVIDGDMEYQIIDGVSDVINRLDKKPKAIEVYTSCIHYFTGCDLDFVYKKLREKFKDIYFTDCYMTPITRKSGITPDEKMRMQLYSLIKKTDEVDNSISMIGNVYKLDETSDFRQVLNKAKIKYRDITLAKDWNEYQDLAKSKYLVYTNPAAEKSCKALATTLDKQYFYFPINYTKSEIIEQNQKLCNLLGLEEFDTSKIEAEIETLSNTVKTLLENWKIVLDYSATSRVLNLARFLIELDLNVEKVYLDSVTALDKKDFIYLKEKKSDLILSSPTHPSARFLHKERSEKVLAIGQKCAYYENTSNFVNLIEGGSYWGFDGLKNLLRDIIDAVKAKKDVSSIIQVKGWGCEKC